MFSIQEQCAGYFSLCSSINIRILPFIKTTPANFAVSLIYIYSKYITQ